MRGGREEIFGLQFLHFMFSTSIQSSSLLSVPVEELKSVIATACRRRGCSYRIDVTSEFASHLSCSLRFFSFSSHSERLSRFLLYFLAEHTDGR